MGKRDLVNIQAHVFRLTFIGTSQVSAPSKILAIPCLRCLDYETINRIQIADTFENAFSELLDTYEYIGENLPLLLQYQELFRTNPHMIKVLSLMYEDILKFHRIAIQYFQQRRQLTPYSHVRATHY